MTIWDAIAPIMTSLFCFIAKTALLYQNDLRVGLVSNNVNKMQPAWILMAQYKTAMSLVRQQWSYHIAIAILPEMCRHEYAIIVRVCLVYFVSKVVKCTGNEPAFCRNFCHWLHRNLPFWHLPVRPVKEISSKLDLHFVNSFPRYLRRNYHQMPFPFKCV